MLIYQPFFRVRDSFHDHNIIQPICVDQLTYKNEESQTAKMLAC